MAEANIEPGRELLMKVRGSFVYHGSSLSRWCSLNGVELSNARQCLMGTWNGAKGTELRKKLIRDSKVLGIEKSNT